MTAFVFGYGPDTIEIPAGATVDFIVTSKDVVHGFRDTRYECEYDGCSR